MALSGLEIFKLLPRTNCGDCGVPTCMAFAMKLAQKKAELGECPHAAEEAKSALGAASEPPVRLVRIGGANPLEIGNETVMFRHDKTFFHQTGIAVVLKTSESEAVLKKNILEIENFRPERVGEQLTVDLFFIRHDAADEGAFLETIELKKQHSSKGLILECADTSLLQKGLDLLRGERPCIFFGREASGPDFQIAEEYGASLILTASSLEDLADQAEKAKEAGIADLLLHLDEEDLGQRLQKNTILRRSALKNNFKSFGYPLLSFVRSEDLFESLADASVLLCKYSSIIVLPRWSRSFLYTLFTLRQNIFTDPQKPIQVDPKVYPIGDPTQESPVFVTTNFSLTYFMVSGEIENSGISAHLVITDVEGQSVLTAWAAGKFVGATIAKFIKDSGLENRVKTRKIVIPGFVSQISGDLEESLPGWQVIVGPQEASDIPSFVKNVKIT